LQVMLKVLVQRLAESASAFLHVRVLSVHGLSPRLVSILSGPHEPGFHYIYQPFEPRLALKILHPNPHAAKESTVHGHRKRGFRSAYFSLAISLSPQSGTGDAPGPTSKLAMNRVSDIARRISRPSIADDFSSANLRFSASHVRVVRLQIPTQRRLQRVEIQTAQHDGLFRLLHVHVERDEFRVLGVVVRENIQLDVPASERLRDRSKHNQAVLLQRRQRRMLDPPLGVRQRWQHFYLQLGGQLHMVLPEEQVRSYSEKLGGGEERKELNH